ncbi:MAG: ATP-binding protein [Bacteriovoracia bacterium]
MTKAASIRLRRDKDKILDLWVKRALKEVPAANHLEDLSLRDSLPEYLDQLADALSTTIDRTDARVASDKLDRTRVGKKHGMERARSLNYSMDQLIFEYHILRRVVCDVLESEMELKSEEREIIVSSVEQAVNDAATQFSDSLKDIQDQLTRTLAHDFRTPLSVAKLNLQIIMRRPDDVENILSKASRASVNLDRLDRMIQDLLDASRMKTGTNLNLEFQDCDLNWIVKEVLGDLNINHNNDLIIKSTGPCIGKWNESGLRRIVENLVTNAIKYGNAESPITIGVNQTEETAILSVHNIGQPIPPDDISILFQQFRRSRLTEKKPGWGLGLTVVKGMTEAHKGEIEVTSTKEEGTTFKITIPRYP